MPPQNERPLRASLNRFFVIFLVCGAVLAGAAGMFYRSQSADFMRTIQDQERYVLGLQQQSIDATFKAVIRDLSFLIEQNELRDLLDRGSAEARQDLAVEFLALSKLQGVYDQVRLLDENGMERIRVNLNTGVPSLVPDEGLQDKAGRYYFMDTFSLDQGQVYVSPLDLKNEHGDLGRPYKPMIRFGAPVFDSRGKKRGVVLLNYLARNMLDQLTDVGLTARGQTMLLNSAGYWLLSNTHEDEWGFMIPERADRSFVERFPDEWSNMLDKARGQFTTEKGMFTFAKVFPLEGSQRSSTGSPLAYAPSARGLGAGDYYWVLVSYIPHEVVQEHSKSLMLTLFLLTSGLFVIIALVAWLLALAVTSRRIYRAQLESMAHYDSLTGLPNRILFHDRLRLVHESAVRYNRMYGVMRLDLSGPGPERSGQNGPIDNEILFRVAEALKHSLRKSDTVARLGNRSFAVILSEIASLDSVHLLNERVMAVLRSPHCLDSGPGCVTVCLGAAVYPDHGDDPDDLVNKAVQAMGVAKARGRNSCVVAPN